MRNLFLYFGCLFWILGGTVDAADFRALYDSGKYPEALQALSEQTDSVSPEHFYNLGTVYYQLNQPGLAVAYLEKAVRMKPNDKEIHQNLQMAIVALGRLIGNERVDPASDILLRVGDQANQIFPILEFGAALSVLAIFFLGFSLIRSLRKKSISQLVRSKTSFIGCGALFLALGCLALTQVTRHNPAAIVLSPEIIRSGPGDRFLELSRVEAGMKLRVQDTQAQEHWQQVRYSRSSETQGIGWIRSSSILLL